MMNKKCWFNFKHTLNDIFHNEDRSLPISYVDSLLQSFNFGTVFSLILTHNCITLLLEIQFCFLLKRRSLTVQQNATVLDDLYAT